MDKKQELDAKINAYTYEQAVKQTEKEIKEIKQRTNFKLNNDPKYLEFKNEIDKLQNDVNNKFDNLINLIKDNS